MARQIHTAANSHMEATVLRQPNRLEVSAPTDKLTRTSVATVDLVTRPQQLEATVPMVMVRLPSRMEIRLALIKRLRHSEASVVMVQRPSQLVATVAKARQLKHTEATDRRPVDSVHSPLVNSERRQATLALNTVATEAIAARNTETAVRNMAATVAPARVATVDLKLATAVQEQATALNTVVELVEIPARGTVATAALAVKLATVDLAPRAMVDLAPRVTVDLAPRATVARTMAPATASREDLATAVTIVAAAPATEVTIGNGEETTSGDDMKPLALFISSVSFMVDKKMKMI